MAEFTVPLASIWLTWQVTTIKWTFYGTNLYRKLVITFSTDRTIVRIKFLFLLGTALYVLESAVEIFFLIPASSSSRVSVKLLRYPCKIFVSVASFSCHFVRVYTHGRVLNGYHINWGLFGTRWSLLYAFWRLEMHLKRLLKQLKLPSIFFFSPGTFYLMRINLQTKFSAVVCTPVCPVCLLLVTLLNKTFLKKCWTSQFLYIRRTRILAISYAVFLYVQKRNFNLNLLEPLKD